MSKSDIRTGIVGSGFAADFHYRAINNVRQANVEIRGVYSPTAAHREAFAAERDIRSFDSLEALVENCDVVHVCSPPSSHERIAHTALEQGVNAIIEKPFTGFFGEGVENFHGDTFPREHGLKVAEESIARLRDAEARTSARIYYAENWVYAPAVQKEREVIEKTGSQVLRMLGEQFHSGSHSPYYGMWKHSGGGSLMGKAVHPLTAALYLKKVEGRARNGQPIRPSSVSARTHAITRADSFDDRGHLRTGYTDIEDYGQMHVVFEDGTFADIFAGELVMGGVKNQIEVASNMHRTICNLNPNNAMVTYNPVHEYFDDIYVVEKADTKAGWAFTSPEEAWFHGYQHEVEAFYADIVQGNEPESDSLLAADTIRAVYAAYLSAERSGAEVSL